MEFISRRGFLVSKACALSEKWIQINSSGAFCPTTTLFTENDVMTVLDVGPEGFDHLCRNGFLKASGALPGRSPNAIRLHNFFDILECHFFRAMFSREALDVCHGFASLVDTEEPENMSFDVTGLAKQLGSGADASTIRVFLNVFSCVVERLLALLIHESDSWSNRN